MWNNTGLDGGYGGGDTTVGGGGFMNSGGGFDSPSGGGLKKVQRSQNILTMTVRSILENTEETLKVEGLEVSLVSLCGIIRSVEITSSRRTYTLDDHTGIISVMQYSADESDSTQADALAEGLYARVFGTVRSNNGKKTIMSFKVQQLDDHNYLTTHILEVIYQKMKLHQLNKSDGQNGGAVIGGSNAVLPNSSLQKLSTGGTAGGSSDADLVCNAIRSFNSSTSVTKAMISQTLNGRLGGTKIDEVMDHLLSEGMIYTTHDDDHFMIVN